ncbi:MAG TPA: anhydro-N-acetylmuramic acid kinase [Rhizomicrobium sp.]|jgi:anhydro-N-acetylmuramic acid kinase|nr:anhydro-N-acetylmuramic acid kinase [Rhizomicrobium sp.]
MPDVQKSVQKVIGLMSGTSLDGIDAALVETDGEDIAIPGATLATAYDAETRAILRAALDEARGVAEGAPVPWSIREAERRLTEAHAEAVKALLQKAGLSPRDVALIGFHGQTILHRPHDRWTWQIGDGALLARLTGIDVVNDFRSADVKAGGQGAPLVPLYHAALVRKSGMFAKPVVLANIGGVANVTYVGESEILAFDTGPGNAPIDDWALAHTRKPVDEDGALARKGKVDHAVLTKMLAHEFFDVVPPKSLDRLDFTADAVRGLSPEDGAATLTAFTAASLARAREHFADPANTWIVCGGGRHNPVMMAELRARVNAPVLSAEDAGWRGDFIEAEAFAYLAARSVKGLPLSLPTTTGVREPMTGGKFHKS